MTRSREESFNISASKSVFVVEFLKLEKVLSGLDHVRRKAALDGLRPHHKNPAFTAGQPKFMRSSGQKNRTGKWFSVKCSGEFPFFRNDGVVRRNDDGKCDR